jgi:hypothetical protein
MNTRPWNFILAACLLSGLAANLSAAIFTVTTTNDSGAGSLRGAILAANANPGADTIAFNLPGDGVQTICPLTALPPLTNAVTVDGYTQPGSQANTLAVGSDARVLIRLDGRLCTSIQPNGLKLHGNGGTVRGLIIVKFSRGIHLDTCIGAEVSGNWIGLDFDHLASPNLFEGIYLSCPVFASSTGNRIGGLSPADRNVISGNGGNGIFLFGQTVRSAMIQGNYIGTDATGTLPRPNGNRGILVQDGAGHLIGGTSAGARNVISGNRLAGVYFLGGTNHTVQGNFIGLDASGANTVGNAGDGIGIQNASATWCLLGGMAAGAGNVIAGNQNGIYILGAATNYLYGNLIGTDATATRSLGNLGAGISLSGASDNVIGGAATAANTICYSTTAGVLVDGAASGNSIRGNHIFGNRGLGIDLIPSGVNTNDVLDGDSGPNDFQNYPTITNAAATASSVRVQGGLSSAPSSSYTLDFYASTHWDFDGLPEGQTWLGAATVTTDAEGGAGFDATFSALLAAAADITATATDTAGNTSEFSFPVRALVPPAAPALQILNAGGTNYLLWPDTAGYAALQATLALGPAANWFPVTSGVVQVGTNHLFALPVVAGESNAFFRLAAP